MSVSIPEITRVIVSGDKKPSKEEWLEFFVIVADSDERQQRVFGILDPR